MNSKLSLEALEVLDAIARKGSFAAAAASLFRVPSAITYTVRKLESDLGITLFNREGHRATLTEAGEALLREGRMLLEAACELEARVLRVAHGVETHLTIAVNDLFDLSKLHPLLTRFYAQAFGTRLKLIREVYGGSWDALTSGRAEISIGAPGEGPPGDYHSIEMGKIDFVYAVAPFHPLAHLPAPLENQSIMQYCAISAADTSRQLAPRTSGILTGQDVLTVPDMQAKMAAQISGLGVGYLPRKMAEQAVAQGLLVIKQVADPKPEIASFLAWRSKGGKAQQWLIKALRHYDLQSLLY